MDEVLVQVENQRAVKFDNIGPHDSQTVKGRTACAKIIQGDNKAKVTVVFAKEL